MKKVVVVDDDPTNMGLIKMLLELDGYQVGACATLDEATRQADEDTAAFVVDCHLARGVSGLELVEMVRSGNTNSALETVIIVTSGDHRLEEESLERGADLFLLKPYPPASLSEALNNLLENVHDGE